MKDIELDLYKDMVNIYKESDLQCNYRPTRFLQMLNEKGALITAKELINKSNATDGFTRLWECNRLDLSLEALVLKEKYIALFSEKERNKCKERLISYGYVID